VTGEAGTALDVAGEMDACAAVNSVYASGHHGRYTGREAVAAVAAAGIGEVPVVGSVMAWLKLYPSTPPLPDGWVECNGQVLADVGSPYYGQAIPDLNGYTGVRRFLRGSAGSGSTGGQENHSHSYTTTGDGTGTWQVVRAPLDSANHLPPYYEVVWIMRVK